MRCGARARSARQAPQASLSWPCSETGYRALSNSRIAIRWQERRAAASEARRLTAWRATPCTHGIVGRQTADACSTCVTERERLAHEQGERQRREDIRQKARALEGAEVRRLARERRRRVHSLLRLSPRQFETAIAELYEARGFQVTLTPSSNDSTRAFPSFRSSATAAPGRQSSRACS
jgi:hypothetical protein